MATLNEAPDGGAPRVPEGQTGVVLERCEAWPAGDA
jgi:hypothetical protein